MKEFPFLKFAEAKGFEIGFCQARECTERGDPGFSKGVFVFAQVEFVKKVVDRNIGQVDARALQGSEDAAGGAGVINRL